MANDGESAAPGVQSVRRAFAILELFEERRPALSTSEIAGLARLNRATTYRFCQTLVALGYLDESPPGMYRPGLRSVSLARAWLSSRELPDLALPYLRDLRAASGCTVNMALLDGWFVVFVARLLNDDLLALRLHVGSRLPAHATSLGRVILAHLPAAELGALLDDNPLTAMTERTITSRQCLEGELQRVRSRGYAINDQELAMGSRGVAAAVLGVSARPIAAVNVSIIREPEPGELEKVLAPMVVECAAALSHLAVQLALDVAFVPGPGDRPR